MDNKLADLSKRLERVEQWIDTVTPKLLALTDHCEKMQKDGVDLLKTSKELEEISQRVLEILQEEENEVCNLQS